MPGTPEFMQMLTDYESATRAMAADGVLVDSGPLQPPSALGLLALLLLTDARRDARTSGAS